jgi:aryl-alcohol dehydrogenase-like predicted oxidoreductase
MGQVALAFGLKFAGIGVSIPGAKSASQTEQNISASGIELSDDLFKKIRTEFAGYNFFLRYHVRV